jgi:basic membrane protein A
MKNMNVAVFDSIAAVVDDSFEGGLYTGTLENGGVGIAPYHEFEDDVPADLATQVEEIQQQIISGELAVADYL